MSSSDRRPYLTATALTQDFLDACHDNLECGLEMICEIETPDGIIYASDRNKYVGEIFYEALLVFPTIQKTVGEWLAGELQFATLTLELSNVDKRFNKYLPAGSNYGNWIGKRVVVKLGLAEQASTYKTIFSGTITPVGGFRRTVKSIVIVARDDYDKINVKFPTSAITYANYPRCEQKNLGKILPIIYGDYTVELDPYPAAIPAYCVNGNDPEVSFKEKNVLISGITFSCTAHGYDEGAAVEFITTGSLPTPLAISTIYYVRNPSPDSFNISLTSGGALITTSGPQSGSHSVKPKTGAIRADIQLLVSFNANFLFEIDHVYVKRNEIYTVVPSSEILTLNGDKNYFTIRQSGSWMNDGSGGAIPYEWSESDEFYCRVIGKDISSRDNPVAQVKDLLKTFGNLSDSDFDPNWTTYQNKNSPSQSAIALIKSRIWTSEPTAVLTYALSVLEQIRLEAFINQNGKIQLNSLHFEDWNSSPTYTIQNWDIERNSLRATIDDRNNFNRAQGAFNFLPVVNENIRLTSVLKNQASIIQTGLTISKKIVFPNLYIESQVVAQLKEILRIASGVIEILELNLTWRALLLEIGNLCKMDIDISAIQLSNVPVMVREIGYDPDGFKIVAKLWSFQMLPFNSWNPGYVGITGGQNAIIEEEI